MTFLEVWLGYAIIGALMFSIMFVWAVRTGQFTDMDRARHIALNAAGLVERRGRRASSIDRYAWVGIILISSAMLGYTLWVALR